MAVIKSLALITAETMTIIGRISFCPLLNTRREPRAPKTARHHHKPGCPDNLAADDKQQQAADVRGGIQHFSVGGRFGEVKSGQRDKRRA